MDCKQIIEELMIEFSLILEAKNLKKDLFGYIHNSYRARCFLHDLDRYAMQDVILGFRRLLQKPSKSNKTICLESALKILLQEKLIDSKEFKIALDELQIIRGRKDRKSLKKLANKGRYAHNDQTKSRIRAVELKEVDSLYLITKNFFKNKIILKFDPETHWNPKPSKHTQAILNSLNSVNKFVDA